MNIAIFCGSSVPHDASITEAARQLGERIASGGHTLVYGGSNLGLMGAVSSAAMDIGGTVVGVIPTFFGDSIIESQSVTRIIRVPTMAARKECILAMGQAFVALPGGIGTLDEVSEVMVANQLGQVRRSAAVGLFWPSRPMILLNLNGFYDSFLRQLEDFRQAGLMHTDGGLRVASSVDEVFAQLPSL